jgi:hypothetical protein
LAGAWPQAASAQAADARLSADLVLLDATIYTVDDQQPRAEAFAVRDGNRDARTGRSPYFWTVLHDPARRRARLVEGLKATARVLGLGIVIDAVYQFRVLNTFYPDEALAVAAFLAFVPYLLIRGPVDRVVRRWLMRKRPQPEKA